MAKKGNFYHKIADLAQISREGDKCCLFRDTGIASNPVSVWSGVFPGQGKDERDGVGGVQNMSRFRVYLMASQK